jgi:hypothetical protein
MRQRYRQVKVNRSNRRMRKVSGEVRDVFMRGKGEASFCWKVAGLRPLVLLIRTVRKWFYVSATKPNQLMLCNRCWLL